jgi:hypothetical protein
MSNKKNSSNKLILFLVIGLIIGFRNAQLGTSQGTSGTSTYHQIEAANQEEREAFERIKINKKEELDKVYGNGLYLEDVEEINAIYEKKYISYLEKMLEEIDMPFAIEADVEFYTSTLKSAKENDITFEEVMKHPGDHIRTVSIFLSGFDKKSKFMGLKYKYIQDTFSDLWKSYKEDGVKEVQVLWSIYDKSILEVTKLENIKAEESQFAYLDTFKSCLYRNIIMKTGFDSYEKWLSNTQSDLDIMTNALKHKYKEDFIGIINLDHKGPSLCTPANDITLYFETGITAENMHQTLEDKYISLLVEKKLRVEVDKLLKEVGLDNNVVPVIIPMDNDSYRKLTYSVNQPSKLDTFELINGYFDTRVCVTLHYIKTPDEEINYSKLFEFYKKMRKNFTLYKEDDGFKSRKINQFVYFYEVTSEEVKEMLTLNNKKNHYWSQFYKKHRDKNVWAGIYQNTDESDSYFLVPVYGEKLNFILEMNLERYMDKELEEFIKYSTKKNKL